MCGGRPGKANTGQAKAHPFAQNNGHGNAQEEGRNRAGNEGKEGVPGTHNEAVDTKEDGNEQVFNGESDRYTTHKKENEG